MFYLGLTERMQQMLKMKELILATVLDPFLKLDFFDEETKILAEQMLLQNAIEEATKVFELEPTNRENDDFIQCPNLLYDFLKENRGESFEPNVRRTKEIIDAEMAAKIV